MRICEACAPDPASWRRRAGDVPPCDCCGSWTKAVRRTAATEPLSRGLEVHRERTDRTTTPAERKAADGSVRNTSRAFRVVPAGWSREEDVQKRREAAAKRNAADGRDAAQLDLLNAGKASLRVVQPPPPPPGSGGGHGHGPTRCPRSASTQRGE